MGPTQTSATPPKWGQIRPSFSAEGLNEPAPVIEATAAYRAESDAIGRFLNEACHQQPTCRVQSSALFTAWTRWCSLEGLEAGTNKAFTTAVQNSGFDAVKNKGRMVWHGLGLVIDNSEAHE